MRVVNGKLDADGNLVFKANDIDPLCDFCCFTHPPPVAALLVETRRVDAFRISEGEWYVCRACLELVMVQERTALAARFTDSYLRVQSISAPTPLLVAHLMNHARTLHAAALDQLTGWPTPLSLSVGGRTK